MNKFYKVVWNASLGAWVAVSEAAKGKTKTTSTSKKVSVALTFLSLMGFSSHTFSGYEAGGATTRSNCTRTFNGTTGEAAALAIANENSIACASSIEAIAIGANIAAQGEQSTVIGNDIIASTSAQQSVVIGSNFNSNPTTSNGKGGVAIGSGLSGIHKSAIADGQGTLALGSSGDGSTINGTTYNQQGPIANAAYSAALMAGATTAASADKAIAFGVGAQATANAKDGLALGTGAVVSLANSVALGPNSTTSTPTGNALLTGTAAAPTNGVISVGSVGGPRRIQNVADGAAPSDAATIAQLDKAYDDGHNNLKNVLGGNAGYNPATNTYTAPTNLGGTGKNTIDEALKAVKTNVVAGSNIAVSSAIAGDGSTTFTVATSATPAFDNVTINNPPITGTDATNKTYVDSKVQNLADSSLGFLGDTGSKVTRKLGEDLNVKGGATGILTNGNIGVEADDTTKQLTVKLAKDIDLGPTGSITTGNSKLDNSGLVIIGGPSITTSGIDAGNTVISNVASGGNISTNAANIGDIQKAAAAAKTVVQSGTNTSVSKTTDPVSGSDTYTVNADGTSVSAASALQVTKGAKDANNITDYQIDLAQSTKDDITKGVDASKDIQTKGLTFTGDSGTTGIKKLGDTVAVTGDNNISTTATATGIQVQLNPNLDLGPTGSITTGNSKLDNSGLVIIGGPSITTSGIDAGNKKITNIANGTIAQNSKDGVNGGQIYNISDSIKNSIGGNTIVNPDGSITTNNIGGTGSNTIDGAISAVKNDAVKAKTTVTQGSNISVKQTVNNDGSTNYEVSTNKDLVLDSVTTGDSVLNSNGLTIKDGPSVTKGGINAAEKKITNIANGTIAQNSKDGVNGSQIHNISESIKNSIGGNTVVNPDGSISTTNIGGTGSNTIDGAIAEVRNDTKAAKTEVKAGSNITVTNKGPGANGQDIYEVATAKNVSFDSVSSKSVNVAGVIINENGINAGNKKITNVADGAINATSKDAINGSQLNVTNNKVVEFLGGGAGYDNITNSFTSPTYKVDGKNYNNVGGALDALNAKDNALNTRIDNIDNKLEQAFYGTNQRIDDVEKKANAGVAAAMALEAAPFVAGKYTYAAGAAYHGGENAVGVTLRKTSDNGRWSLTGGVAAASQGDPSVRIGISGVID